MITNTVRSCRAKNPSTCPHHGTASPESMYQSYMKERSPILKDGGVHPVVSASTSSLKWVGDAPVWWEEYKTSSITHGTMPSTPELLDVIDSPMGPLAVVWQPESQDRQDLGITLTSGFQLRICYFKSVETGEILGQIKMANVNEYSFSRSFGNDEFTSFRWQDRFSGSSFGFKRAEVGYEKQALSGEELTHQRRKVWLAATRYAKASITTSEGEHVSYRNLTADHVPDDKTVVRDLKVYAASAQKEIKDSKKYYSTPYVDYGIVEEDLQGKGLGASLYIYAARRLGQQGQVLRSSGIQSPEAEALWGRFKKYFPQRVSNLNITYKGNKTSSSILDFRN